MLIGLAGAAASAAAQNMRENANRKIAEAQSLVDSARKDYELRRAKAERRLAELYLFKGDVVRCVIPHVLHVAEQMGPVQADVIADASETLEPFDHQLMAEMNEVVEAIGGAPSFDAGSNLAVAGHHAISRVVLNNMANPQIAMVGGGAMAAIGVIDLGMAYFNSGRADEAKAGAATVAEDIRSQLPIFGAIEARIDEVWEATEILAHGAFRQAFMLRRIMDEAGQFSYGSLDRHDRERVLMFIEFSKALWKVLGARVIDDTGAPAGGALPHARCLTSRSV